MQYIQTLDRTPRFYERLDVGFGAVVMLTALYRDDPNINAVFLTVETANIRYRIDGGDPDANDGHIVYATGNLYLCDPHAIHELRMITFNQDAASVIVTYYV